MRAEWGVVWMVIVLCLLGVFQEMLPVDLTVKGFLMQGGVLFFGVTRPRYVALAGAILGGFLLEALADLPVFCGVTFFVGTLALIHLADKQFKLSDAAWMGSVLGCIGAVFFWIWLLVWCTAAGHWNRLQIEWSVLVFAPATGAVTGGFLFWLLRMFDFDVFRKKREVRHVIDA